MRRLHYILGFRVDHVIESEVGLILGDPLLKPFLALVKVLSDHELTDVFAEEHADPIWQQQQAGEQHDNFRHPVNVRLESGDQ